MSEGNATEIEGLFKVGVSSIVSRGELTEIFTKVRSRECMVAL